MEIEYKEICPTERIYPIQLIEKLGGKAPQVLYCLGDTSLLSTECISMVGARTACLKSLEWARKIAIEQGVKKGKTIVSGYARGVDKTAMQAAIDNGGKSIAIIPEGLNSFVMRNENAVRLAKEGSLLIVSPYPIDSPWTSIHALERNTYIYAMSNDTYVAESNNHGGTWSGANRALKKKWNVCVRKPGEDESSEMANLELIRMGAIAIDENGNKIEREITQEEKLEAETIEKIKEKLHQGIYDTKTLSQVLGLDWSTKKLTNTLDAIEGIVKINEGKKKLYTLTEYKENNLFF